MKRVLFLLLTLFAIGLAMATAEESIVAEFSWRKLAQTGQLKTGTIVEMNRSEALKIENAGPNPLQVTLFVIEKPEITTENYRLAGEVRYEDVSGDGFLEMWSHFGESVAYFSRTMGEPGPMGKLRGTSDWRPFILPFVATGSNSNPSRIVVNLNLPGKGNVYLRYVKLIQSSTRGMASNQRGAWWSSRTAGLIGGIVGTVVGCLGGLMQWLVNQGRSRAFVLTTCMALIVIGALTSALGLVAIFVHQPYQVWYVLLLLGGLCVLIFPFRLRHYQEHYRDLELRRIAALDAA